MNIEQKRIETSKDLIKTQSADGNWNYDPYMYGMLNGMLLTHSVFTDEKYKPYNAPKRWIRERWYERIINKITGKYKVAIETSYNSDYQVQRKSLHPNPTSRTSDSRKRCAKFVPII